MKVFIILLTFLPFLTWAQKDEIFAKFINEDGSAIKGSSVTQFYERQIPLFSIETNSAGNSTIVNFAMPVESASGVLRNLQNSQGKISSGEMVVTYIGLDKRRIRYKINMENIAVEECTDSGSTTIVKLHASRIGWTYYSYTKSGIQSITSKNGWDEDRGKSWTGF